MPLPRIPTNTRFIRIPVTRLTMTGIPIRRAVDGSMPKKARFSSSIVTANSTALSPASTPTTIVSATKRWLSRSASL